MKVILENCGKKKSGVSYCSLILFVTISELFNFSLFMSTTTGNMEVGPGTRPSSCLNLSFVLFFFVYLVFWAANKCLHKWRKLLPIFINSLLLFYCCCYCCCEVVIFIVIVACRSISGLSSLQNVQHDWRRRALILPLYLFCFILSSTLFVYCKNQQPAKSLTNFNLNKKKKNNSINQKIVFKWAVFCWIMSGNT